MITMQKNYSDTTEPIEIIGRHFALSGLFGTEKTAMQLYIEIGGGCIDEEISKLTDCLIYQPGYPGYGEKTEKYSQARAYGIEMMTAVQLKLREGKLKEYGKLADHEKKELAMAFLAGKSDFSQELNGKIHDYIMTDISELTELCFSADDPSAMGSILDIAYSGDIETVDEMLSRASEMGKDKLTAFLIDYKHRRFTPDDIERAQQEKIEKELGFAERSEEEWRKLFRFEKTSFGVNVSAYKGYGTTAEIPPYICDLPVVSVGGSAVGHRADIECIILPPTVEEIKPYAFSNCTGLKSILLPEGLKTIGKSAFQQCKGLAAVVIPDGTESLGASCFWGCESLREVSIPASVKYIGQWAFSGCGRAAIRTEAGTYAEKYARENNIEVL